MKSNGRRFTSMTGVMMALMLWMKTGWTAEVQPSKDRDLAPYTDGLLTSTNPLPASFDWRNHNGHSYIGPIRDHKHTGMCYAFGACAAAEGAYNIAHGLYDSNCVDFSEMYITWTLGHTYPYNEHINNNGVGADSELYELSALTKVGSWEGPAGFEGACSESNFPFVDSITSPPPEVIEQSKTFPRITFKRWKRVFPQEYSNTTEQIKVALMTYGPVDAQVVPGDAFGAYTSGVYDSPDVPLRDPYYYSGTGHFVSLVGWDDNPPEGGVVVGFFATAEERIGEKTVI
jgi:C1A family cysteine protease